MKVNGFVQNRPNLIIMTVLSKHIHWDPKDGELCLDRVKSEETLMEARSGSDVQIDRRIWVEGRKTNRTI